MTSGGLSVWVCAWLKSNCYSCAKSATRFLDKYSNISGSNVRIIFLTNPSPNYPRRLYSRWRRQGVQSRLSFCLSVCPRLSYTHQTRYTGNRSAYIDPIWSRGQKVKGQGHKNRHGRTVASDACCYGRCRRRFACRYDCLCFLAITMVTVRLHFCSCRRCRGRAIERVYFSSPHKSGRRFSLDRIRVNIHRLLRLRHPRSTTAFLPAAVCRAAVQHRSGDIHLRDETSWTVLSRRRLLQPRH